MKRGLEYHHHHHHHHDTGTATTSGPGGLSGGTTSNGCTSLFCSTSSSQHHHHPSSLSSFVVSSSPRLDNYYSPSVSPSPMDVAAVQMNQSSITTTTTTTTTVNHHQKQILDDNRKIDDALTLINNEMNSLSIEERERVYEDIHGVSQVSIETIDFVSSKLQEFDIKLQTMKVTSQVYLLAESLSYEYVTQHKLRLMFLRSDSWNITKSVHRFLRWFQWKLQLFGSTYLVKDITWNDLNEYDKAVLQSGQIELLTARDTSGRAILYVLKPDFYTYHFPPESMIKALYYRLMCVVEDDIDTQRNGIVLLGALGIQDDNPNSPSPPPFALDDDHRKFMWDGSPMISNVPVKLNAIHVCVGDIAMKPVTSIIQLAVGQMGRARFRIHFGTITECRYSLLSFGIPVHVLSLLRTTDNSKKLDTLNNQWIQRRQSKEAYIRRAAAAATSSSSSSTTILFPGVDLPSRNDVILGRGNVIQAHPGNKKLQELINRYKEEYETVKGRGSKRSFADKIVELIQQKQNKTGSTGTGTHNGGGQFLKRVEDGDPLEGWYIPVPNSVANDKVCDAFRALRRSVGTGNGGNGNGSGSGGSLMNNGGSGSNGLPSSTSTSSSLLSSKQSWKLLPCLPSSSTTTNISLPKRQTSGGKKVKLGEE